MKIGELVRDLRVGRGVTQTQLALRAGTTQAAISRLERDERPPALETVERVLLSLGYRLALRAEPLALQVDELQLRRQLARPPAERLAQALAWNRFAATVTDAGKQARAALADTGCEPGSERAGAA